MLTSQNASLRCNVNAVCKVKRSALHRAVQYGRVNVMNLLLENGADVNAVGQKDCLLLRNCN